MGLTVTVGNPGQLRHLADDFAGVGVLQGLAQVAQLQDDGPRPPAKLLPLGHIGIGGGEVDLVELQLAKDGLERIGCPAGSGVGLGRLVALHNRQEHVIQVVSQLRNQCWLRGGRLGTRRRSHLLADGLLALEDFEKLLGLHHPAEPDAAGTLLAVHSPTDSVVDFLLPRVRVEPLALLEPGHGHPPVQ